MIRLRRAGFSLFFVLIFFALGVQGTTIKTDEGENQVQNKERKSSDTLQERRINQLHFVPHSGLMFHLYSFQQSYFLPAYYTERPAQDIYASSNPNGGKLPHTEIKFQFSLKALLTKLPFLDTGLYVAYTQLSYWQAYQKSAYFRESEYEPEMFFSLFQYKRQFYNWDLDSMDVGLIHQSNGLGGDRERSWNRFYVRQAAHKGNWLVRCIFSHRINYQHDHNPDIVRYLGNDDFLIAYQWGKNVFSANLKNQLSSGFSRGAEVVSWSFPLAAELRGFVQLFSGYGQSLGEYKHYTNSVGVGFSFSDWSI